MGGRTEKLVGETEGLVVELKTVRRQGLVRLRDVELPRLTSVVRALGLPDDAAQLEGSLARLLTEVIAGLDDQLANAAACTFGLARGSLHWSPAQRRQAAAEVYGIDPQSFRRRQEIDLLHLVAARILASLARPGADTAAGTGTEPLPIGATRRVEIATRQGPRVVTVHRGPVEALRDVDVVVSSENTYLEMAKTFRTSLSGSLRNAAARRDAVGGLVEDVLQDELREWLRRNGRTGLSVAPGVVVPTSSGELAKHGIRRVYHAAVAEPRPFSNGYDVSPGALQRAVRNVFLLARADPERPPLRSVCLPLLGAGRAGLEPATSFGLIWRALLDELDEPARWEVHLLTRSEMGAAAVIRGLEIGAPSRSQARL
ncbi:macro domain-containing protein [Parafrankia discariae]|uniref:hypothetical protein n=1 Tax=Parafrankia discariae TaxID=365528 RepID=UPI001E60B63D|nr:hypothetical protein [Parafrankia discariae]